MIDKPQHNRFKDAPWYPSEETHILIGGAGGIGSWLAFLLARSGFKPMVYDFDRLEEHNLGGQLFPKKLIGNYKVDALTTVIKDFSDEDILTFTDKIDENTPTHIFAMSAFDNMLARKNMFMSWFKLMADNPDLREKAIFIDGRLNAEQMQILCVQGKNKAMCDKYIAEYLFDDSEVEDAPCTMKQTSHAAAMIAAHMTGFFTNHFTNFVEGDVTRAVPFYWEYFIPMDLLEVKNE